MEGTAPAGGDGGDSAAQHEAAHRRQQLQHQLTHFWNQQWKEMEDATDFRNHNLPLARIKKIMKSDEEVRMISAEAPMLFAKACEMFILELTLRSWYQTEESKRRTLQRSDVEDAVHGTEIFDFLTDTVPRQTSATQPQQKPQAPPARTKTEPNVGEDALAANSAGIPEAAGTSVVKDERSGDAGASGASTAGAGSDASPPAGTDAAAPSSETGHVDGDGGGDSSSPAVQETS